jgi:hypothetical protein
MIDRSSAIDIRSPFGKRCLCDDDGDTKEKNSYALNTINFRSRKTFSATVPKKEESVRNTECKPEAVAVVLLYSKSKARAKRGGIRLNDNDRVEEYDRSVYFERLANPPLTDIARNNYPCIVFWRRWNYGGGIYDHV